MADSGFMPDRAGLERLALSGSVRSAVKAVADHGKDIAEGLAAGFTDTGDYLSHFETGNGETTVQSRFPHRAATGVLRNTSGHAAAVEWGYHGRAGEPSSSAHHVLTRTLDALDHG